MKVGQLIDFLMTLPVDTDVVIHRDAANYGFGTIRTIVPGIFATTDYGNDFYVDQALIVQPNEIKAVCLYPEEWIPPHEANTDRINKGL